MGSTRISIWKTINEADLTAQPGVDNLRRFAKDTGRDYVYFDGDWQNVNIGHRGAWSNTYAYKKQDLVTYGGAVWRALRANVGVTPVGGADWTVFLAFDPADPTSQDTTRNKLVANKDLFDRPTLTAADARFQLNLAAVAGGVGDNAADDTAALQAKLSAGGWVHVKKPASAYKITSQLTVPSGTRVTFDPGVTIRQATKYKPVFDLLDSPGVTLVGNDTQLRYEGDRTYSVAVNVRGAGEDAFGAAVWTNSDRTRLEGSFRVYGFTCGVFVSSWDTAGATVINDYKTKRCVIEDLETNTVDFGVLAGGFDGLKIGRLRGSVTRSPTSPNPPHLLYCTLMNATPVLNRGLDVAHVEAWDSVDAGGAAPVQLKGVRGGTIGRVYARNCSGVLSATNAQDALIGSVESMDDQWTSASNISGCIYITEGQGVVQRLKIGQANIQKYSTSPVSPAVHLDGTDNEIGQLQVSGNMGAGLFDVFFVSTGVRNRIGRVVVDKALEGSSVKLDGTDCDIGETVMNTQWSTVSNAYDLSIAGTRNNAGKIRHKKTGAGNSRVVLFGSSTECGFESLQLASLAQFSVELSSAVVRPKINYSIAHLQSTNFLAATQPVNPQVQRAPFLAAFTLSNASPAMPSYYSSLLTTAQVTVTATSGVTVGNPNYSLKGFSLTFEFFNNSGGAMGTITWGSEFVLDGTFTGPANGSRKRITFSFDGTNWREDSRSG